LFEFRIDPEKCRGCEICKKQCPTECISGERRKPHVIDPELCIKCGVCYEACPFDAIFKTHEHLYRKGMRNQKFLRV